jgi:nitrate/TMAO reductase-like tetraheme cytochrome c subunit
MNETQICIFCHTPHTVTGARVLWNRELSNTPFVSYTSPSLDVSKTGVAPQPNGSSKLCLSCHDGTLALGALSSRPKGVEMRGVVAGRIPPDARGYLGRDLSGAHPISFQITSSMIATNNAKDSELVSVAEMTSDPDVRLDHLNRMQCGTCHDPHADKNFVTSGVHFYRKENFSDVCEICHRL